MSPTTKLLSTRNSCALHHVQTCHILVSLIVHLFLHHWRGWKSIIYLFCIVIVQGVSVTCGFVFKGTLLSSGFVTLERNRITESHSHTITVLSAGLRCARMAGNNPKRGAGWWEITCLQFYRLWPIWKINFKWSAKERGRHKPAGPAVREQTGEGETGGGLVSLQLLCSPKTLGHPDLRRIGSYGKCGRKLSVFQAVVCPRWDSAELSVWQSF